MHRFLFAPARHAFRHSTVFGSKLGTALAGLAGKRGAVVTIFEHSEKVTFVPLQLLQFKSLIIPNYFPLVAVDMWLT